MLRTFRRKAALTVAATGAALILSAGPALAAGGWTIAAAPPTGQNATLTSVATVSDSDAWAAGYQSGNAFTNVGAKALIDDWNGTAWSQVAAPATPGNTALLYAVSASSAIDAWAVGRTQVNKSSLQGLALHWNGTAWSVSAGFPAALSPIGGASAAGVADVSPSDAYAVGNSAATAVGSLVQWNGTAWSAVTLPLPANANSNTTLNAIDVLSGVTTSNASNNVWAVGADVPAGGSVGQTLTLNWNGTAWNVVASPNTGSTDTLSAVATSPGAAIVWAVGESGPAGSFNPLVLQNG